MALQLSGDIAGLGKIVQIVRATDGTDRSTTSSSFVDASISVTITPTKTTSAIIIMYLAQAENSGGLSTGFSRYQITDNSNNAISGAENMESGVAITGRNSSPLTLIAYATPATASAVTYKVRFKNDSGGNTANVKNANCTGQLYAIEVAA